MGGNAVAVAFPEIRSSFNTSIVLTAWVLSVYPLATIVSFPLSGKASDVLGRKRTFTVSVLLFGIGSLLCALAPNVYWLILARVFQGIGSGGFATSAAGIVADAFPESRQRSIGLLVSLGTVGTVYGLTVGGWLTQAFGWRSIFWFGAVGGAAALIAALALLKKDGKMGKADLDMNGAGLLAVSVGSLMIGLTTIGSGMTTTSWVIAACFLALGSALLLVFLRHEQQVKNPLIELEVLRGRPFVAANLFNTTFGLMLGVFSLLPLYAVTIYNMSVAGSGLIVTPRSVGLFGSSIVCSFFLVRWGYRKPMLIGTLVTIAACSLFGFESNGISLAGIAISGVAVMVALIAITGLGQGLCNPASNNACIELLPDRVSTIMGVRNAFRHVGQSFGVALASIVLEGFGSLSQGFRFVFFGTALVALITIPCIFGMPRSPSDVPPERAGK
jgi:EmrB/QacA subfamily drug resistance transporter